MTLALVLLALSGPAPFTLVNGTGQPLASLSATPLVGGAAKPVTAGPLPPGGRASVPALGGDLCAFVIEADDAGTRLRWSDVNLCDVKVVTLRRRGATLWADYD
jgi:hypothetical protein